jgi:hypothetical protein
MGKRVSERLMFLLLTYPLTSLPADVVVVVHFAFVLFVIVGGLLVLRWPWLALLHVPAAIWGAWIEFTGGICPLTPLENALRARAGQAGYPGGFIEHYILPVLYPSALTRTVQIVFGAIVFAVNLSIYVYLVRLRHLTMPAHLLPYTRKHEKIKARTRS